MAISRWHHVVALTLDADGALVQATAVACTAAAPALITRRMLAVERYGAFWPWMHTGEVVSRTTDSARFRVSLASPLAAGHGEFVSAVEAGGRGIRLDGVSGDFAGERHRWDLFTVPGEGTYAMYTSTGADLSHAPMIHRALIDRDVWAAAGMGAYWTAVMVRYGLWALL
jgi:hypothetical protein